MSVEECIERVEKFFLRALLASEKLNVVDQKEICLAIALPEFHQIAVLDGIDEFVDEELAGEVHHLHVFVLSPDILTDRLHQMRLAETNAAINEQRIVSPRRRLSYGKGRGVRNFIVRADHKRFERVSWIETEDACTRFCARRRLR